MGSIAGAVLILALWSLWPSTSTPATAPAPARAARARGKVVVADAPGPMAPVKLAALTASRQEPGEAARNPFRFQPRAVPPPTTRAPVIAPPISEPPRVAGPPPGPPPAPPIPLKFTGMIERANGVKWAVLTDGKSGPMYGKDGDIIDGRYLIVKIGTESVEMTYADGRGRQVIRLTGQ